MQFSEDELAWDRFLDGRLRVLQPRTGYRAGVDPVFLAAAVPAREGQSVLELGCGVGVASLCLGRRVPGVRLTGLEVQPAYADLARRNAEANAIAFEVIEGDLGQMPAELKARAFDHVIANPPYHRRSRGSAAKDAGRERALGETLPLSDWVGAALRRLRPGGRITMIQRAERLPDLLGAIDDRAGSIALRPLAPRSGRAAQLVLVSAIKGGRAAFRFLPQVVLHAGEHHVADGDDYTSEVHAVLRDGAAWALSER